MQKQFGCPNSGGEFRVFHESSHVDPAPSAVYSLCTDEPNADLATKLREL